MTKILAMTDALSNLVRCKLLPGQCCETTGVAALIAGFAFEALICDKAYDADWFRKTLADNRVEAVIPARKGRIHSAEHDAEKYKMAAPHREFLAKIERIQAYSHAHLLNRYKLLSHYPTRLNHHSYQMNVNRP